MSFAYDLYLAEHKENVRKGYDWLKNNIPNLVSPKMMPDGTDLEWQIGSAHDQSKSSPEEYAAYDAYFYGGNRSFDVVSAFNLAWLHHIHNNPHHWQYWILVNDDPKDATTILDMPYNYIVEMTCDWWSFSWMQENLLLIFDWYNEHKDYIQLSEKTKTSVDIILNEIKSKLYSNITRWH